MINRLTLFIATGFGSGFIPVAPGTWGTAAGALIYWYLLPKNTFIFAAITILVFLLAVPVCSKAEKIFDKHDDPRIVIDEVVGLWISVMFLPARLDVLFTAFVFFRLFDIYKPYIVNKAQNLPAGWGVMTDDAVAGIFTNIVIRIFLIFIK